MGRKKEEHNAAPTVEMNSTLGKTTHPTDCGQGREICEPEKGSELEYLHVVS